MRVLFIALMSLVTINLSAQNMISLDSYRDLVIANSDAVKIANVTVDGLQSQSRAAYAAMLPQFSASGDFSLNLNKQIFSLGAINAPIKPYSFSVQPQVVQSIYNGGVSRNSFKRSEVLVDIASLNSKYTLLEVSYAAEYAYWNLSANIEFLRIAEQYVEIIESLREVIRLRFEDGYIDKSDLLMMDVQLEEAKYSLINAKRMYYEALSNFNLLIDEDPFRVCALSDGVLNSSSFTLVREELSDILSHRPDYLAKVQGVKSSEYDVKVVRGGYDPQLSAGVMGLWGSDVPNLNNTSSLNGVGFAKLSMTLFGWGARRHKVASARSDMLKSQYGVHQLEDDIKDQESSAWITVESSASQVESSKRTLILAKESLDINTYSYNEGQATILDVMSAQASWLQLYTNVITAGYNHHLALSRYRMVVGEM